MADNTESIWWYELKVNFYIENGKGEYEWDDSLVIPRKELKAGMSIFGGLDRKGGWTRWGNQYVEEVKPTGVLTTAGLLVPGKAIIVKIHNVMPYYDGYYSMCIH